MIYEYNIIGKILYKIDRGGEGGQAILYEYKIANLPKLLIPSLILLALCIGYDLLFTRLNIVFSSRTARGLDWRYTILTTRSNMLQIRLLCNTPLCGFMVRCFNYCQMQNTVSCNGNEPQPL